MSNTKRKEKKKLVCGQNCLVSIFREKMAYHMIKIYKLFNVEILGIARLAKQWNPQSNISILTLCWQKTRNVKAEQNH